MKDEWELRQLCGNGACVGVLRADGTCPRCMAKPISPLRETTEAYVDEAWDARLLCPNGACVGILRRGVCPFCGHTAERCVA